MKEQDKMKTERNTINAELDTGTLAEDARDGLGMQSGQEQESDVTAAEDAALSEHRAALRKMRAAMAVDELLAHSGARDSDVVRTLLNIQTDAIPFDGDGVPDIRTLQEKLQRLKRDCGYLFRENGYGLWDTGIERSAFSSNASSATGMNVSYAAETDDDALSDEAYYRKKRNARH